MPTGDTIEQQMTDLAAVPKESKSKSPPVKSGGTKKRNKISDEQYMDAVRLVIGKKMSQSEAETKCGLWSGALSKGKGAEMLQNAESALVRLVNNTGCDKTLERQAVQDDFRYNH